MRPTILVTIRENKKYSGLLCFAWYVQLDSGRGFNSQLIANEVGSSIKKLLSMIGDTRFGLGMLTLYLAFLDLIILDAGVTQFLWSLDALVL